MKLNEVRYIFNESFRMLKRRKGANAIAVVIMGLSLLILVVFLLVTLNISRVIDKTSDEMRIFVYLEDGIGMERSKEIQYKLLEVPEVEEVIFIPREEAMESFRETLGEESDLLETLEENPLPDSYRVKLKQGYIRGDIMERIASVAEGWDGVEDVRYGRKWFERGEKLVRGFYIIDMALGLIVFLSVVFVISNTVRLTIHARGRTIEILKLVGATNAYIRIPFVIEGALQGLVSSLLAIGLLSLIYTSASKYLHGLVYLRSDTMAGFVVFCSLLGALGSYTAMRRFLRI